MLRPNRPYVGQAGYSVDHQQGLIELAQLHFALDRGDFLFAGLPDLFLG